MATNKLLNFRCPDELLSAIEAYGVEVYPSQSKLRYDQSKTVRDILVAGLETLTKGEVRLDRDEIVKQNQNKSDNRIDLDAITAQISLQFEERFTRLESKLEEALKPSMRSQSKRLVS